MPTLTNTTIPAAEEHAWIGAETIINVGAVIGILPVTGIPLPFISYGGSSLVVTMVASGLLVSIARHERVGEPAGGRRTVSGRRIPAK